jgi:hypothetical protein
MGYTYQYLNPSEFSHRNQEFCKTDNIRISPDNAKEVGIICLRTIQIYQETQNNISREKSSLKMWVRDQRSSARNHGRIIRYKGASRTRASINASISNINDQVLNSIDSMLRIIDSNLNLAEQRMRECLNYTTISDIKSYEATYIEEQNRLKEHKSLKEVRIALYISIVAVPICFIAFFVNTSINFLLSILFVIAVYVIWGVIAFNIIKRLTERIERYEKAKSSIGDLKIKKALEEQDSTNFFLKLNNESDENYLENEQESDNSETYVIHELANKLREEYVLLENACLNFDIDANNWLDLAEKIHNNAYEPNEHHQNQYQTQVKSDNNVLVKYTVSILKSRFSSFQEAKEYFGTSAKSWQALVDKLNSK